MKKEHLTRAAIFLGGVAVGGVVTYYSMRKRFDEHYSQLATDEIASVKRHFHKKEEQLEEEAREGGYSERLATLGYWADTTRSRPTPSDLQAEEVEKAMAREDQYDTDDIPLVINTDGTVSPVVDDSMIDRDLTRPYLITQAEYEEAEDAFDTINLVYYEEDGVIADERDFQIDDIEPILGDFSVRNFGHNNDPHSMLIRNTRLGADYEITIDRRSYSEVVLGVKEPQQKPPIRKMRDDE